MAGLIRKESRESKGTQKNTTGIPDFVTDCSLRKRWLHLFAEKWPVEQVICSDCMITLVIRKKEAEVAHLLLTVATQYCL